MDSTIEAIYENGVLRPLTPLTDFSDGQRVTLRIRRIEPSSPDSEDEREHAFLRQMESEGLLEKYPMPDAAPPENFKPLVIDGPPLSETIIEDRR